MAIRPARMRDPRYRGAFTGRCFILCLLVVPLVIPLRVKDKGQVMLDENGLIRAVGKLQAS